MNRRDLLFFDRSCKQRGVHGKAWLGSVLLALIAVRAVAAEPPPETKYQWLRHARIFLVDAYTYPLYPEIEFDAEKLAETMVDMHANTVRIATSGHYYLIPGTQFKTAPDLGDRDILAECIAACKPRGIRVVPYFRTGGGLAADVVKPEWAYRVNPQGDIPIRWNMGARRSALCWNSAYREAFLDLIEKVVSRYDIDGVYFDSWVLFYRFRHPKVCYCEGCKRGFKDATGLDLPYRENANRYTADEWRVIHRYHDWYREELYEAFRETKRVIRSHKDIPLIFNINNAGKIRDPMWTHPRIVDESDGFLYEMSKTMLERAEGTSLAVSHGLAVWPYADAYHGYPRIGIYKYGQQQRIYTTIAFGGSPVLYHAYSFVNHPDARAPVREAFRTFDKNKQYTEGFESDKFCAVVWNRKDPPGHAATRGRRQTSARHCTLGAFAACMYGHVQATSLLKEDLDHGELLNQYKVLYLPDICQLTQKQLANIRQFVARGGGLVMTYATSLYDEQGKKLADFALGDIARVQYLEPDAPMRDRMAPNILSSGSVWDLYLKVRDGQQVIRRPLADDLMPAFVYQPVKALPGGTVAADIVVGTDSEPIFPGLVVSRHGKGKVAYIPAALDAIYLQTHTRQFRDFLRDVIRYVSPDGLPYEVDAPSSVIVNMTSRGDKRVFHLINWTGCKLETAEQNVYYIPPVENVTIRYRIPRNKKITKVGLFTPAAHRQQTEGSVLRISLPKLEKYQAVIVEMAEAKSP